MFVAAMSAREPWEGGYTYRRGDGRRVFVIERRVGGERFHISTHAHSYEAAMKQLARFEADPRAYQPSGSDNTEALRMTDKLVVDYFDWQVAKGVTRKWAKECNKRLTDWVVDLNGVDLRRANLRDHIKPALEKHDGGRQHRIEAIKGFYAWLRKERHLLTSAQDPTLDMPVPQGTPAKRKKRKAVEWDRVQAAAAHLEGAYLDCLVVLIATGWHVTELERFVRSADSQINYQQRGDTQATLSTQHKNREMTRTPITDPATLAAAERLRARGTVPRYLNAAVKAACRAAEVEEFTLGVMRHSVATWAVEGGAAPEKVAEFLQHKDARTTKRFYADVAVPTTTVPLPRLQLVR